MSAEKRAPYMKFYARDWRGDGALRMCSFAARGLWADLLSLMHDEGEPYGHLIINGSQPTTSQLARMLGGTARELQKLLDELENAGVFSRTETGAIFSRRMVRDREKEIRDRENGKCGGSPKINQWHKEGVNPGVKGGVNPLDKGDGNPRDKAHSHSHSHSQKPEPSAAKQRIAQALGSGSDPPTLSEPIPSEPIQPNSSPTQPNSSGLEQRAESAQVIRLQRILGIDETDFRAFARDVKTVASLKAEGCDFDRHLLPAAEQAARSGPKRSVSYIAARARELRDAEQAARNAPVLIEPTDMQGWRDRVRVLVEKGLWHRKNGPRPGDEGCVVPKEILAEFGLEVAHEPA